MDMDPSDEQSEQDPLPDAEYSDDLSDEIPGPRAVIHVERYEEMASLAFSVPFLRMRLRVQGPGSWAPALCCFFAVLAIGGAILASLFVPAAAASWVGPVACGGTAGLILLTGGCCVIYLLRRLRPPANLEES